MKRFQKFSLGVMFHAKLKDPVVTKGLSCIAMVTCQEGDVGHASLSLVNQYSEEMFLSEDQKEAFSATQTELSGGELSRNDKYTNMALLYLYRKATEEVKEFNSPAVVEKI